MKAIIKALKGERVEIRHQNETTGSFGFIQGVNRDKATVGDEYGGAYFFPVSEVVSVHCEAGKPAVITLTNWQA